MEFGTITRGLKFTRPWLPSRESRAFFYSLDTDVSYYVLLGSRLTLNVLRDEPSRVLLSSTIALRNRGLIPHLQSGAPNSELSTVSVLESDDVIEFGS